MSNGLSIHTYVSVIKLINVKKIFNLIIAAKIIHMDFSGNRHQSQFNEPIPKRSKFRINIFVCTCWEWHKQMRENVSNTKNKLIFASWNEPHSLSRRLAIALRENEANPNDFCNYKDPFNRLGDRYRAYWMDHREYHRMVFNYNEPLLEFPENYEKPIFIFGNAFPSLMNVVDIRQRENSQQMSSQMNAESTLASDVIPGNGLYGQNSPNRLRDDTYMIGIPGTSQQQQKSSENSIIERPTAPSPYVASPELIALMQYINSRSHEICLSMTIDYLNYGQLITPRNNRRRLHEILINAGFSCEFISRHDDYMGSYISDLIFAHGSLWKTILNLIEKRNSTNRVSDYVIADREISHSEIVDLLPSSNVAESNSGRFD